MQTTAFVFQKALLKNIKAQNPPDFCIPPWK